MRSFDNVDFKLAEADFFLEKMREAGPELMEVNFYFSAFISAARSVTFALQAVMNDIEGFKSWYSKHQETLKNNHLAKFFLKYRNEILKTGELPITRGSIYRNKNGELGVEHYLFEEFCDQCGESGLEDAASLSKKYMKLMVGIVHDCYQEFGPIIDTDQLYALENIDRQALSIEDVEESLDFPRGWTSGIPDRERIRLLRESVPGSQIKWLFEKYLGSSENQE